MTKSHSFVPLVYDDEPFFKAYGLWRPLCSMGKKEISKGACYVASPMAQSCRSRYKF